VTKERRVGASVASPSRSWASTAQLRTEPVVVPPKNDVTATVGGVLDLGIQLIGMYVSSAIYISLFMRMLGKYSWGKSAALGVAISVLFFLMFEVWFQVPLYKGHWNLTGWTGY
jgi:hypothetical protein